jgi:hypothetical protein
MILTGNGKECREGLLKFATFFVVSNQQSTYIDVNKWVFYASLFFLLHKFLGCVILLSTLFFFFHQVCDLCDVLFNKFSWTLFIAPSAFLGVLWVLQYWCVSCFGNTRFATLWTLQFGDLFGTYFVILEHSWASPIITWGFHCKFGKQCFWWFIYSIFVLIS